MKEKEREIPGMVNNTRKAKELGIKMIRMLKANNCFFFVNMAIKNEEIKERKVNAAFISTVD